MTLEDVVVGVVQFYSYALFLGLGTGLVIILFAIMFKPKRGGMYNTPRRVSK